MPVWRLSCFGALSKAPNKTSMKWKWNSLPFYLPASLASSFLMKHLPIMCMLLLVAWDKDSQEYHFLPLLRTFSNAGWVESGKSPAGSELPDCTFNAQSIRVSSVSQQLGITLVTMSPWGLWNFWKPKTSPSHPSFWMSPHQGLRMSVVALLSFLAGSLLWICNRHCGVVPYATSPMVKELCKPHLYYWKPSRTQCQRNAGEEGEWIRWKGKVWMQPGTSVTWTCKVGPRGSSLNLWVLAHFSFQGRKSLSTTYLTGLKVPFDSWYKGASKASRVEDGSRRPCQSTPHTSCRMEYQGFQLPGWS